ncbi:hypothetical protein ACF0H5_008108 [Mactra antiquata]
MKIQLACLILGCVLPVTWSAYKGRDCPSPCRCYEFLGVQSAYCNGTGITSVPRGFPNNTQLLDLSSNPIKYIKVGDIEQLPNLQSIVLNSNGYHEGSIEPGALDLPKLTDIDLGYNLYRSIPMSLPKKITSLTMFYNPIYRLKAHSFLGYPNLQEIVLDNTELREIENGTFYPLPDLQSLRIAFNKLTNEHVPSDIFSKNVNLTDLSMRFNHFTQLLTNLPSSILNLDYVGNHIKTLPSYGFNSTPNLQTLAFWEGQVTTIEDNAFYGQSQITILDFMQDHISSTITKDTFSGLTGLQTLYLDLNNISKIQVGAFHSFSSLGSLWLQSNRLTYLEPEVLDVKYIPKLSELYIDDNPWYCDCHLRWLREKVNNASYVIQDPHLITCAGPSKVAGKAWDVLKPADFVCP